MSLSIRLRHRLGARFALDVALEAPPGVTVLFGKSGSGKTSIVNAVAGLLRPEAGRITVNGAVLLDVAAGVAPPPWRRRVGYIFQEGRLFPHLTVRRNLLYGRWFAPKAVDAPSLDAIVAMLDLAPLLERRPGALSGGEKQRVAIGRALLAAPRLFLADEPLAALDAARKEEILPYFERLRDAGAAPILYVTHSVAEAARLATTVALIEDGRVARVGPAAAALSDPQVAASLGVRDAGSILVGRVVARAADGLAEIAFAGGRLILPDGGAPLGAQLRVRVEASDVILARERPLGLSALNILEARIVAMQQGRGPGVLVGLTLGRGDGGEASGLLARVTRRSAAALGLEVGQSCFAVVKTVSVAPADVGRGAP